MPRANSNGTLTARSPIRARRRVANVVAMAAMGSWVVLAMMPVVVVIVALS